MKSYLWHLSVYSDDSKTPSRQLDVPGSSVDVKQLAQKFEGDRFEAVPMPLECLGIDDCQYDHLFFAAMKIGGELPQALVD